MKDSTEIKQVLCTFRAKPQFKIDCCVKDKVTRFDNGIVAVGLGDNRLVLIDSDKELSDQECIDMAYAKLDEHMMHQVNANICEHVFKLQERIDYVDPYDHEYYEKETRKELHNHAKYSRPKQKPQYNTKGFRGGKAMKQQFRRR